MNISDLEKKRFDRFCEKQRKKQNGEISSFGGRFSLILTPTGIGIVVEAIDNLLNIRKDITDYDCW
jgi:hypothetical protein